MNLKYNQSISYVPTVRINEFVIHGNIDCEYPVTTATCTVLAAICAGFIQDTQPDVCFVTPSPIAVTCTVAERDCNGTCFGNYEVDLCGMFLMSLLIRFSQILNKQGTAFQSQVYYGINVLAATHELAMLPSIVRKPAVIGMH